jgi:hypothetical protein
MIMDKQLISEEYARGDVWKRLPQPAIRKKLHQSMETIVKLYERIHELEDEARDHG